MYSTDSEGETRVALYARSELPPPAAEQRGRTKRELETLADRGVVDSIEYEEWDKRVPTGDCDDGLRDTYLSFTGWADSQGVSLTPFFGTRECYSPETGEMTNWLVLPALCLAIYEDGELTAVYPHDDGSAQTVQDGIEELTETDDPSADVQAAATVD